MRVGRVLRKEDFEDARGCIEIDGGWILEGLVCGDGAFWSILEEMDKD